MAKQNKESEENSGTEENRGERQRMVKKWMKTAKNAEDRAENGSGENDVENENKQGN